jgi:hypothetical protein
MFPGMAEKSEITTQFWGDLISPYKVNEIIQQSTADGTSYVDE